MADPKHFASTKKKGGINKSLGGMKAKDFGLAVHSMHKTSKFPSKAKKGDGGQMARELAAGKNARAGTVAKQGHFKGIVKAPFKKNKGASA